MNIGNYILEREIGSGGMATVFLAKHNSLNKQVAIKVLRKEYVSNENIRKRFHSEARQLFEFSHPNIVKVIDLIEREDFVGFVMEFVDGVTLKDFITQRGALSETEITDYFSQILAAVNHVHANGLVHRDIKPSNFIIANNGKIKLLDFGIVKNTEDHSLEYTQTGTGLQMGTPMYMSPEQITETKSVTFLSDIYSLGVVLWQMVTGRKPYDTQTLSNFQLLTKIVNEKLPLTNTFWDHAILKATNKDENMRYPSCKDFATDINQIVNTTPTYTQISPLSSSAFDLSKIDGVVLMPRLSDTMTEGVIVEWYKQVGDNVRKGDLLAEVETDKATMELESYVDGVLLYVGAPKGGSIQVNGLMCIIGEEGKVDVKAIAAATAKGSTTSNNTKKSISESDKTIISDDSGEELRDYRMVDTTRIESVSNSKSAISTDSLVTIKSPMIGTFYRKQSPDKPNLVDVGSEITTGTVLCIVEAMKLFNEIESEVNGRIVKVLVDDASPVDYDQPLFLVETALNKTITHTAHNNQEVLNDLFFMWVEIYFKNLIGNEKVYLKNKIPPNKLNNFATKFNQVTFANAKTFVYYDDTIFGKGDDGFVIMDYRGNKYLYISLFIGQQITISLTNDNVNDYLVGHFFSQTDGVLLTVKNQSGIQKFHKIGYKNLVGMALVGFLRVYQDLSPVFNKGSLKFSVVLIDSGSSKLNVVKVVKDLLGLELNDSKKLVDNPPKIIVHNTTKLEAELALSKLKEAGANALLV